MQRRCRGFWRAITGIAVPLSLSPFLLSDAFSKHQFVSVCVKLAPKLRYTTRCTPCTHQILGRHGPWRCISNTTYTLQITYVFRSISACRCKCPDGKCPALDSSPAAISFSSEASDKVITPLGEWRADITYTNMHL